MKQGRRRWIPVLVALLVAVLLGPAGGGAVTAVEPRTVTASIMIPAAALVPITDGYDYVNNGYDLYVGSDHGYFTAPVLFPVPLVSIRRITLYAWDDSADAYICVWLYRATPAAAGEGSQGQACTTNSAADPQAPYGTATRPRQVNTAFHGSYLWVRISAPGVRLYGVKVTYAYETGA